MWKHPFDSAKHVLARAKDSIQNYKIAAKSFLQTKPWTRVIEADPSKGPNLFHKIKLVRPLPIELVNHAADAASHLRSALDHAAFATLSAADKLTDQSTHFPISVSAIKLEEVIKKSCKKLPPDIVNLFRTFQPYKGGNDPVWALNQVCNANKHRLLTAVGIASGGVEILHAKASSGGGPAEIFKAPKWDSTKDEMIIAIMGPSSDLQYKINITMVITFGEVDGVRELEVLGALRAMLSNVNGIVFATEAEAKRLGIVS